MQRILLLLPLLLALLAGTALAAPGEQRVLTRLPKRRKPPLVKRQVRVPRSAPKGLALFKPLKSR